VKVGDQVLMDDGNIQLTIEEVTPDEVRCRVIAGGRISDHKGLSLPRVPLPISCLTDKDREDLRFGIQHGVDFVAISFVRTAADIAEARKFLGEHGADIPLVAKLERRRSWLSRPTSPTPDAVMVARGDLGVDAAGGRPASTADHPQARRVPVTCHPDAGVDGHPPAGPRGPRCPTWPPRSRGRRRDHAVGRDRHRRYPPSRRGDGAHLWSYAIGPGPGAYPPAAD
jgi:hypothetical protein